MNNSILKTNNKVSNQVKGNDIKDVIVGTRILSEFPQELKFDFEFMADRVFDVIFNDSDSGDVKTNLDFNEFNEPTIKNKLAEISVDGHLISQIIGTKDFQEIPELDSTKNQKLKKICEYTTQYIKEVYNQTLSPLFMNKQNITDNGVEIKIDGLYNPRFYNFENEDLDISISYNTQKLLDVTKTKDFEIWFNKLAEDNKSRDGFVSFFPTSIQKLRDEVEVDDGGNPHNISSAIVVNYLLHKTNKETGFVEEVSDVNTEVVNDLENEISQRVAEAIYEYAGIIKE